ncbi:TVP38/TMEM64 family protein [Mobilibacterium timonense]|uniref:TVP38/TMEM64 family protein n=1 Tax=Mobilibacterium timonense TaxID=1871012 RepID=UPI000985A863|nr:TVP38/TMEM64 family protein [Mobilibacterium timonense]
MKETNRTSWKKLVKPVIFAAAILIVFLLNRRYGWSDYFTDPQWYQRLQETMKDNYLEVVAIYMVVMIVGCVVLALPGVTFAIIAGTLFGPWIGTLLCSVAATIGAILAFLVGRFFLRDSLRDKVMKNKYIDRLLFDEKTKNEMTVLMVTRLVPIFPYNLQNFAYGITDMSLAKYSLGTFVFMIPGTAMYTFGTYAVIDGTNRLFYALATVVIAAVVIVASRLLKKKYVGPEEGGEAAPDGNATGGGMAGGEKKKND